jgi:hypothetical protein
VSTASKSAFQSAEVFTPYREFADIPVMQVRDRLIDVPRAEAAHIGAWMKAGVATNGQSNLEGIAHV